MNRSFLRLLVFGLALPLGACQTGVMPESMNQAVGGACMQSSDCQQGLECEVEHGQGTCQPHGGRSHDGKDDNSDGGGGQDDNRGGSDGGGGQQSCAVDADCPQGQECEIEHGTGFCKPHGGQG